MTPEEFRQARHTLGLNQSHLANMLGYSSKTQISMIENGWENPSKSVLRLLRAYLDGYRPDDWPV
ncbi:MAG: helix-turn-helix domain-containing protein [Pseudooceanicola sp.]